MLIVCQKLDKWHLGFFFNFRLGYFIEAKRVTLTILITTTYAPYYQWWIHLDRYHSTGSASRRIAKEPSVYTNYTFVVTTNKVRTFRKRLGPMRVRRWAPVRVYDDQGGLPYKREGWSSDIWMNPPLRHLELVLGARFHFIVTPIISTIRVFSGIFLQLNYPLILGELGAGSPGKGKIVFPAFSSPHTVPGDIHVFLELLRVF